MAEIASAFVSLIPSFKGGQAAIAKELGGVGEVAGKQSGGKFSGAFAKVTKGGALAIGATIGTALFKGFGRLSAIEDAQAKLKGLGNSTKTVKGIMDNALASVKGTAFGLDEAATVAASAVASGIKPGKALESNLKLVADAATIGGTSMGEMGAIFNKVSASGKVQGDVIAQLGDKGIPILRLLGKEIGKTPAEVAKLASEGKIGFETFSKAMEAGLGGAALKSGATTSGAFKNMNAALGRFGATLLKSVFPLIGPLFGSLTVGLDRAAAAIPKVSAAFGAMANFVKSNQTGFKILGAIIGTILLPVLIQSAVAMATQAASLLVTNTAWLAYGIIVKSTAIATKVFTAAQWLLNAALTANPIGLVIIGLAALGAALYLLWTKSTTFRAVVTAAFNGVKKAALAVFDFVKAKWPLILGILTGPIGLAVLFIVKNWSKIRGATSAAFNAVKSAVSGAMNSVKSSVTSSIGNVIKIFSGLLGKIKGALSGAGSALVGIGKNIVGGLISGIKSMGGAIGDALVALLPGPLKKFAGKLGIKSPSTVFRDFGHNIGQGLVLGVDDSRSSVTAASGRLADSLTVPRGARFDAKANGAGGGQFGTPAGITNNFGPTYQQPGESTDELAERLWLKQRARA